MRFGIKTYEESFLLLLIQKRPKSVQRAVRLCNTSFPRSVAVQSSTCQQVPQAYNACLMNKFSSLFLQSWICLEILPVNKQWEHEHQPSQGLSLHVHAFKSSEVLHLCFPVMYLSSPFTIILELTNYKHIDP